MADALTGKFDLVLAESLDRLNRDLEETALLFKQLFVLLAIGGLLAGIRRMPLRPRTSHEDFW